VAFGDAGERAKLTRGVLGIFTQRDAVYAALTAMVRHEEGACAAQLEVETHVREVMEYTHAIPAPKRPSAALLERYVVRLVEQVAVLVST
jgi:hypothetical protein